MVREGLFNSMKDVCVTLKSCLRFQKISSQARFWTQTRQNIAGPITILHFRNIYIYISVRGHVDLRLIANL